ncbi:TetR/AcrR family transcriptional regulator [Luteibacter sp. dw_328]|uniref:TetR/AcrR family transcriptional regulator n=1 Tax=Luteibacter sp. dw_328 TaxID=2719796 RepID=UPI001BD5EEE8|nr:TetR/AcrR family transcriptional regulator [Luteibacter sp. dw_328]
MARQIERSETTRAAIIEAATRLFGEQGFGETSVDQIAAAAHVAKGAVYHHFASKEAIFERVLDAISASVAREVAMAGRRASDALDGIAQGTRAYFRLCSKGPTRRIVLGDGPVVLGWQRWREIDAQHFGAMLPAAVQAAVSQGLIANQPVEPLARLLLGAVTEAAMVCATSPSPSQSMRQYSDALERLLSGLRLNA